MRQTKKVIFTKKNTMFIAKQERIESREFKIASYRGLYDDPKLKRICEECFPSSLSADSMILYTCSEESIAVLGFYDLEELHITRSPRFEQVREMTKLFQGKDNIESLQAEKCVHIRSWIFDESLRNRECLYRICESMVEKSKPCRLLWAEDKNGGLLFYPVEQNYGAAEYFTEAFMGDRVL